MNEIKENEVFKELGESIIETLFPELADTQIAWLLSEEKKQSNGKAVFADCTKVNKRYSWCCPYDFMITVYEPNVARFTDEQIRILLEHELMHVGKKGVIPHDAEDFVEIIRKYGIDWARTKRGGSMATRKGNQKPTKSAMLPYNKSLGTKAVKIYNSTGNTAQKWQNDLLKSIMAENSDKLWTHVKVGYSVPRRNGKSEILMMREMWGLMNNERILHTAHRATTSHASWENLCGLLAKTGLVEGEDYKTVKQFGLERIIMLKSEAVI